MAQDFYTAYVGCLLNPPSESSGKVSPYCQVHTGYTSPDFAQNIASGGMLLSGKDPVTCSSIVPQGYTFQTQSATADGATVIATEGFGGSGEKQVTISLIKENNHWLVANITCPTS